MTSEWARKSPLADIFFRHEGNLSDKWEHYLPIYQDELGKYLRPGKPVALLEIGVQNGGSLQIWSKFLPPGSSIVGIDINAACADLRLGASIEILIADAGAADALDRVLADRAFDVIIDDGSHHSDDIKKAFLACFRRVVPGGLYIVEDLHCSYMPSMGGGLMRPGSAIEFFKLLCDGVNADHFHHDPEPHADLGLPAEIRDQIARISFYDSVVVIEKALVAKAEPYRRIMTGAARLVEDPGPLIANWSRRELGNLLLSDSLASSMGTTLLRALADAREDVGRLGEQRATILAERDGARAELAQVHERLTAHEAEQGALAATVGALQEERLALRSERDVLAAKQEALRAELRAVKAEQATLTRERDAERKQLAEMARKSEALAERIDSLMGSTSWRVTAPARLVVTAGQRIAAIPGRWRNRPVG